MASIRPNNLSAKERELLALLPKSGERVSTNALVSVLYGRKAPYNARVIIGGRMRSIMKKIAAGCAGPKVRCTKRNGPHPVEWWVEK